MRKLGWQRGGNAAAAMALSGGDVNKDSQFFSDVSSAGSGIVNGIHTGGLHTLFGLIVLILDVVARVLWFLFTVVIPYMVMYFGVPLFILGAIMALIFTVGHVFFLVAFFVGVFLYMRGIIRVAFPTSLFNLKSGSNSDTGTKNTASK